MSKLHAAASMGRAEQPNPFLGLEAAAAQPPPPNVTGEPPVDASAGHAKSALDDLNESIRQAMSVRSTSPGGGAGLSSSPAKQQQQAMGGGGGGGH